MTASRLFRQPIAYVFLLLFFVAACAHKPRGLAGTSTKVDSANRAARPMLLLEEFFLPSDLHLFYHIKGARQLLDAQILFMLTKMIAAHPQQIQESGLKMTLALRSETADNWYGHGSIRCELNGNVLSGTRFPTIQYRSGEHSRSLSYLRPPHWS